MDETQPLRPAQPHDPAPTATSGNRWEPGSTALADPAPHTAYDATWAAPAPVPPATAPTATAATAPRRSLRDRARAVPSGVLAAIGAALLVIAVAIGGFVVGRTTAPEGTTQQPGTGTTDQGGFPGRPDGDGGRQGFPGGTLPGQGTGQGTGTGTGTNS